MSSKRRFPVVSLVLGVSVASASACGGSGATTPVAPAVTEGSQEPTPPPIQATAAPTEESPGVFTGVVTCDHANTIAFDTNASEVVSFEVTFTTPQGSANPSVTLVDGSDPVIESGNPVDVSGALYPDQPVTGRRTYNFRHGGPYGLRVAADQCAEVHYRVVMTRDVGVAPNLTTETATALTLGTAASGTLGCEEHRYFAFDATRRGTMHLTLGGTARIPGGGGTLTAALSNAAGPVVASGNPVTVDGAITDPPTEATAQNLTVPRAGHYLLDVSFTNGCTIADYQITLAR